MVDITFNFRVNYFDDNQTDKRHFCQLMENNPNIIISIYRHNNNIDVEKYTNNNNIYI